MRLATAILLLCLACGFAAAQSSDPLGAVAQKIGEKGLKTSEKAPRGASAFKRSSDRSVLDAFVQAAGSTAEERKTFREVLDQIVTAYEDGAKGVGLEDDAAGALAFAVTAAYTIATGTSKNEDAFPAFANQLRAVFEVPEVRAATDAQKQAYYQRCLGAATLVFGVVASAGTDKAALAKARSTAESVMVSLIGVKSDAITFSSEGASVKPSGASTGFSFTPPANTEQQSGWVIKRNVTTDSNGKQQIASALIRLLPAMTASGAPGNALRELWKSAIPKELASKAGPVVFLRYLGNGMRAYFIFGEGRENGRLNNTLFSLYLVEVGKDWMPFVVAQTYEEPDAYSTVGLDLSTGGSWGISARLADEMMAAMRGPASSEPVVNADWLTGSYEETSGGYQEWVNANTGTSLPSTFTSRSFTLNLRGDGTYDFVFSGASGQLGNTTFTGQKDSGTWVMKRDRMILTGKQLKLEYIVAGVSVLADGRKVVLMTSITGPEWPAVTASNAGRFQTFVQKR